MRHQFRRLLLAAALLALPAGLQAQQTAPAQPTQAEVAGWVAEMQQLHTQLQGLQQRALQDPALSQAQEALGTSIKAAMQQADPQLEQSMARVEQLQTQAMAAQQAGDTATIQQLVQQLQQIERQFVAAQQQALEQPEIASRVDAFQSQLEAKMLELDPSAQQTVVRFRELEDKLSQALGAAQQP